MIYEKGEEDDEFIRLHIQKYNRGYNTEIINKQCNTGYPLETLGRPIPRTTLYDNVNTIKRCACQTLNHVKCSITMNVKLLQ